MNAAVRNKEWNGTRFIHITTNKESLNLKRPMTIAYRYNDERQTIQFSIAECSKRDIFCKRVGRMVSYGRLDKHPNNINYSNFKGDLSYKNVTNTIVNQVLEQYAQA